MSELSDARALLKRSASCLLAALDDVEEPTLVKPTPCPEWDVHDLVLHVADAADELTSRATGSLLLVDRRPARSRWLGSGCCTCSR